MSRSSVAPIALIRSDNPTAKEKDLLAVEEPLEIRVEFGQSKERQQLQLAVTMRTPGNDLELTTGFLFTEAIIEHPEDLISVRHCETVKDPDEKDNVVKAILAPSVALNKDKLQRNFYTSSSCGVCGKGSLESVRVACPRIDGQIMIPEEAIHGASDQLRKSQQVFEHTGGLHAAGLFSAAGELLCMREDVGRHNAVDKLIGAEWQNANRFSEGFLMLSGRASFELVQKAARAGIPIVAAVGAPSSLAVSLANEMGITLLGFVRNNSFNCYSHKERIEFS